MPHRILSILHRLKHEPARELDRPAIVETCRQVKHSWRAGLRDPVATVHLFLTPILHGNTAINPLPRLSGQQFTDSASGQARARLPRERFRRLVRRVATQLRAAVEDAGTGRGHRVFVADGSRSSMPDPPELREHFGQPRGQRPGCGSPVAHLLALFHVGTGMLREVLTGRLFTHDMSGVAQLHPQLRPSAVRLGDRGLCSFAPLALLVARGVQGVSRMHQRRIVDFTPHRPQAWPGERKAPKSV